MPWLILVRQKFNEATQTISSSRSLKSFVVQYLRCAKRSITASTSAAMLFMACHVPVQCSLLSWCTLALNAENPHRTFAGLLHRWHRTRGDPQRAVMRNGIAGFVAHADR